LVRNAFFGAGLEGFVCDLPLISLPHAVILIRRFPQVKPRRWPAVS